MLRLLTVSNSGNFALAGVFGGFAILHFDGGLRAAQLEIHALAALLFVLTVVYFFLLGFGSWPATNENKQCWRTDTQGPEVEDDCRDQSETSGFHDKAA